MGRGGKKTHSGTELGYEAKLWRMADALRNNMDAAEYKHVVSGSAAPAPISDAFEPRQEEGEDRFSVWTPLSAPGRESPRMPGASVEGVRP